MVSNQGNAVFTDGEGSHAIGLSRDPVTVFHGVSGDGEDAIVKPLGQINQPAGIFDQFAVGETLVGLQGTGKKPVESEEAGGNGG